METATQPENSVHFDSFELKLRTRELYRDGTRLKVRGHPVDVLAILLEKPGELVSREELKKRLWPADTFVDFEQILNNSVGRLRDALNDRAESPKFIETLPRLGYRFIGPIEKSAAANQLPESANHAAQDALVAEGIAAVPEIATHRGAHRLTKHLILWPLIVLAVVIAVVAYRYAHTPLPAPRITHYEQLTLDGRRKIARGTDGTRIYLNSIAPWEGVFEVPVSGGKIKEIPIDLPARTRDQVGLYGVSSDGSSLLVGSRIPEEEGVTLWIVGAQGHPVRYLTRASNAAWSPDGKDVVYADIPGNICTVPVDGGEPRLLHREVAPSSPISRTRDLSWSPDRSTIRFSRWGGKMFEVSSTGTDFHEWLPGWNRSVQKCCGRWTPDGRFFLFLAGRTMAKGPGFRPLAQIWAVDERRGTMRPRIAEPILLASEPMLWGHLVPSRDGKQIFARGVSLRGELERYDPASKRMEPYLGGISAEMPDFSRDGKYVAYVSFPDGILWRANRDGSGLVQLSEPPFYPRNPRWSPDGAQILFTDNTQTGVDAIYVVSSQGGTPKRLFADDGGPQSLADWSPDGTKVVYCTFGAFSSVPRVARKSETRIVELATGKLTVLPEFPKGFWAPLWSPDGRYIAGHSFDGRELAAFDLKMGVWSTLSHTGVIDFHSWSHDGRFIYVIRSPEGGMGVYLGVYRIQVPEGKEDLVFDLPERYRGAGWYGFWMSLDPTDAPLLFRDVGTDEIYALTLEQK